MPSPFNSLLCVRYLSLFLFPDLLAVPRFENVLFHVDYNRENDSKRSFMKKCGVWISQTKKKNALSFSLASFSLLSTSLVSSFWQKPQISEAYIIYTQDAEKNRKSAEAAFSNTTRTGKKKKKKKKTSRQSAAQTSPLLRLLRRLRTRSPAARPLPPPSPWARPPGTAP